jgi:hypothetical protein
MLPKEGEFIDLTVGENKDIGMRFIARMKVIRFFEERELYLIEHKGIRQVPLEEHESKNKMDM